MAEGFVLFGSNEPMPEVLVMLTFSCSELQARKLFLWALWKNKAAYFFENLEAVPST